MPAPVYESGATFPGVGSATPTHLHSFPSVADGCLVVGISYRGSGPPSAVLYGGVAMTLILSHPMTTDLNTSLWRLVNPPTGANNIAPALAGTANYVVRAHNLSSVDPTTPHRTPLGTGHSTIPFPSVAPASAVGDLVLDHVSSRNTTASTLTVGAGQTQRHNIPQGTLISASSTEPGAAGSTGMLWSQDVGDVWAIVAVSFIGAEPGSGSGDPIDDCLIYPDDILFPDDVLYPGGYCSGSGSGSGSGEPGPAPPGALTFIRPRDLVARVTFTVPTGLGYRALYRLGTGHSPPATPTAPTWTLLAQTSSGSGTARTLDAALPTNDPDVTLAVFTYDGADYSDEAETVTVFAMQAPLGVAAVGDAAVWEITTQRQAALVVELDVSPTFEEDEGAWRYAQREEPSRFSIYPPGTSIDDAFTDNGTPLSGGGWPEGSRGSLVRAVFPPVSGTRYARAYQESSLEG